MECHGVTTKPMESIFSDTENILFMLNPIAWWNLLTSPLCICTYIFSSTALLNTGGNQIISRMS